MYAKVTSLGVTGLAGYIVQVEADLSGGLPQFNLVGLPDSAVKESSERVRSAIKNLNCPWPASHVTVNLAPADVRKTGPVYDLPLLLAVLTASGQLEDVPEDAAFLGELALDGTLRPVSGVLPMALAAAENGIRALYVPAENAAEAAVAEQLTVYPARSAADVIRHLAGQAKLSPASRTGYDAAGQWRAGMWVRDSSAGVGTLTFADEELGVFAGLGHPISDSDTGESVALRSGEIVPCEITGCSAGTAGSPGELKGHFLSAHAIGTIRINGENGVYGTTRTHFSGQLREIAFAQEVVTGPAEIWATIEGETPRAYRIQIERVSDADPRRNLVIRVTDPSLLSATGGIVQGMSGSPILQNGRLVGAVTHVLVNDPTRGYGIFAQTMLEQAKNAVQNGAEAQTAE